MVVCLTQATANEKRGNPFQQAKRKKVWHDLCGCVQFFRLGSYFWAEGIPLLKKKFKKKEKTLLCENTDHFHITTTCSTTELVTVDSGTVGY